jgi:hypothetical protein
LYLNLVLGLVVNQDMSFCYMLPVTIGYRKKIEGEVARQKK